MRIKELAHSVVPLRSRPRSLGNSLSVVPLRSRPRSLGNSLSVVPLRSRHRSLERSGQALMELAVGMLALVMVISTLCGFCIFMTSSLRAQNTTRAGSSEGNGPVEVNIQIGNQTVEKMTVREHCQMPQMTIVK